MSKLRHPHLPHTPPPTHVTPLAVPMKGLGRPREAVDIAPPVTGHGIENRVEVTGIAPPGTVPGVIPVLHGLDASPTDINHNEPEPGDPENPPQQRCAGLQRARFKLADRGRRDSHGLGQLPLAEHLDPPNPSHKSRDRKRRTPRRLGLAHFRSSHAGQRPTVATWAPTPLWTGPPCGQRQHPPTPPQPLCSASHGEADLGTGPAEVLARPAPWTTARWPVSLATSI